MNKSLKIEFRMRYSTLLERYSMVNSMASIVKTNHQKGMCRFIYQDLKVTYEDANGSCVATV